MPNSFVHVAKSEEASQEAKIQNKNNEHDAAADKEW